MGDKYVTEDPDLVENFETDSSGRITLGKEFANENVRVAVSRIKQPEEAN